MKLLFIVSIICAGLIAAGSVQSAEIKIDQRYTGVSHPTMLDANDDGVFANVASFHLVGNPGRATMEGVFESTSFEPGESPCDLQNVPIHQSYVQTYNDGSMLFLVGTAGYGCLNLDTSEFWGELSGIITGGIGRFESATGTWTVDVEAFSVGQTQIVFTGTLQSTVEIPD
ncbi:MAG: hypothetical protein HKO88_11810 [Xanthomonadales bacterium]|nr:hypothetical protein [Xanthomonadales bacterium]